MGVRRVALLTLGILVLYTAIETYRTSNTYASSSYAGQNSAPAFSDIVAEKAKEIYRKSSIYETE